MMTTCDIPLEKVNREEFKAFFAKYCEFGKSIPKANQLRKHISNVY